MLEWMDEASSASSSPSPEVTAVTAPAAAQKGMAARGDKAGPRLHTPEFGIHAVHPLLSSCRWRPLEGDSRF